MNARISMHFRSMTSSEFTSCFPQHFKLHACPESLQHLDAFGLVQSWLSTVHLIFRRLSQASLSSKDGITLGGEDSIGSDSWGWPWAAANSVDPRGKAMMEVILQRFCYQSTSTCRDSPHDGTLPNWALRIMEYDEWHDLLYSKVRLYWFMES